MLFQTDYTKRNISSATEDSFGMKNSLFLKPQTSKVDSDDNQYEMKLSTCDIHISAVSTPWQTDSDGIIPAQQ